MSLQQSWSVPRGSDLPIDLTGPAGVNPSGWTLRAYLRTPGGSTVTTITGLTVSGSGPWQISVPLSRELTLALAGPEHLLDVWRIDSGYNWLLAAGRITVTESAREV